MIYWMNKKVVEIFIVENIISIFLVGIYKKWIEI